MANICESFQPQRFAEFSLRWRVENRAADDEIRSAAFSRFGFGQRMRRNSNQEFFQTFFDNCSANFGRGQGSHAQMNAVGFCRQRHIQSVVDQNLCAEWLSDGNGLASEFGQVLGAQIFFPNLNQLAASGGGLANGFDLQTAGGLVRISFAAEGLAVGDQIKQRVVARQIQRLPLGERLLLARLLANRPS